MVAFISLAVFVFSSNRRCELLYNCLLPLMAWISCVLALKTTNFSVNCVM